MEPARLGKKVEEKTFMNELELFLIRYARFLLPLGIGAGLFVISFALCGICAVESGMLRNFLANGV